jgi:hypothetical protein
LNAEQKVARACVEKAVNGDVFGFVAGDDFGQWASGDCSKQREQA